MCKGIVMALRVDGSPAARVYSASFAFFEALWEVSPYDHSYIHQLMLIDYQGGVTHVFVNLGSDHPSILEAMVKGQKERRDQFPTIITCPNEVNSLQSTAVASRANFT
jgi:hypothetical protein